MMFEKVLKWVSVAVILLELMWLLASFGWGAVIGGAVLMGASMCFVGCEECEAEEDESEETPVDD